MGHANNIITVDVYGDNKEIIADCVDDLKPFIDEVKPSRVEGNIDVSDVEICDLIVSQLTDF